MKRINPDTETFTKGQFANENIYEVADEYPDYIQYLLDEGNIDAEDRELLETLATK